MVWERIGAGIESGRVSINQGSPTAVAPTLGLKFTVDPDPASTRPAISKSGGVPERFLVAWQRLGPGGQSDIYAVITNMAGFPMVPPLAVESGSLDCEEVDVDGDGTRFLLASQCEQIVGDGDNDVRAQGVFYDGTSLLLEGGPFPVADDAGDDEIGPAVSYSNPKYYVAWSDQVSGQEYGLSAAGFDLQKFGVCESEITVGELPGRSLRNVEMASQRSGNPSVQDGVLLVAESLVPGGPPQGDIAFQLLEGFGTGGTAENLGGGCGGGGTISAPTPAKVGDPNFIILLDNADFAADFAILNFSFPVPTIPCGTCEVLPYFIAFTPNLIPIFGAQTAGQTLPIPCNANLLGKSADFQWTVGTAVPSSCSPGFSFSDVLRVTIGE